jgi:hypothetical protein
VSRAVETGKVAFGNSTSAHFFTVSQVAAAAMGVAWCRGWRELQGLKPRVRVGMDVVAKATTYKRCLVT